jgi:uncharacterized membrane protein
MESSAHVRGEARWPMAAAVLAGLVLTMLRPPEVRVAPRLLLPVVELVLLGVLVARDPGRIDRRGTWLRGVSVAVVTLLAVDAVVATAHLITVLIRGGQATASAGALLAEGGIVWASNVLVFSLLYWELDNGGAAARAHHVPRAPDFAFPQQMNPELAPPGWQPQFVDYLYLGLTACTAFSPTDVMPLTPRAKGLMGCESLISLAVLGLVIARAVNVLP